MNLTELTLRDFRNYREEKLEFDPGVNLIVGNNAQGKTNLLEAIAYLGSGKSFRAQKTGELVRFGADFAELEGQIFSQEREQTIRWLLFSGSRPRQIYRSGSRKKSASDIAGLLPAVLFCPEDLMILKEGAAPRRRLGDSVLCQLRPNYEAALNQYGKLLDQKSRILKDRFETPSLLDVLPEFNLRLCQVGAVLISYRARFYEALGKAAKEYHDAFSGGGEDFTLTYKTAVEDPMAEIPVLTQALAEHMERHRAAELSACQCLSGPHRDDFEIALSGNSLKTYGSQGQTRTAAISIKLAQRELLRREVGEEPVLLLDDVLSELDPKRQNFVLNQISSGQVFITCCEPEKLTQIGKTMTIRQGKCVLI